MLFSFFFLLNFGVFEHTQVWRKQHIERYISCFPQLSIHYASLALSTFAPLVYTVVSANIQSLCHFTQKQFSIHLNKNIYLKFVIVNIHWELQKRYYYKLRMIYGFSWNYIKLFSGCIEEARYTSFISITRGDFPACG